MGDFLLITTNWEQVYLRRKDFRFKQKNEGQNSHIGIAKKAIPVSKSLKEELLNRLQTI